jgi:hypothetical protein
MEGHTGKGRKAIGAGDPATQNAPGRLVGRGVSDSDIGHERDNLESAHLLWTEKIALLEVLGLLVLFHATALEA